MKLNVIEIKVKMTQYLFLVMILGIGSTPKRKLVPSRERSEKEEYGCIGPKRGEKRER